MQGSIRSVRAWMATVAMMLAQACGDDGSGDGASGSGGAAGGGPTDPNGFRAIYAEVLVPSCTSATCHGANAGNLNMSTAELAYMNLVGVTATGPSCTGMGLTRVVANDAAGSLLVTKLDISAPPCGVPMPVGGMLPSTDVDRIANWVNAGALDN